MVMYEAIIKEKYLNKLIKLDFNEKMENVARILDKKYIDWYIKKLKFISAFQTSITFGFNPIPRGKEAREIIESNLGEFIEREIRIKRHQHEKAITRCDGTWIWLGCTDPECDLGIGIRTPQVKHTTHNWLKYGYNVWLKNPKFFNEHARKVFEEYQNSL